MSSTFRTWLTQSSAADFESFVRTRRDLLRPESPTIPALPAAASSRIGVSRAIEALNSGELDVLLAMAKAARVTPEVDIREIGHSHTAVATAGTPTEAALARLRALGLAWPTSATGTHWRIQSEAITLLPTSAADSSRPLPWHTETPEAARESGTMVGSDTSTGSRTTRSAGRSAEDGTESIPQALIHNGEQAAVAEAISTLRGLVDELSASPISRLTSGGISKRDVSRLSRALDVGLEQTITMLLAAKALGLIGVLEDPLDPQWTATEESARMLSADRAELWSALVGTWLREHLDVTQLAAGASENERLTVLATPKKALFKGFGLSAPTMPLLRFTVLTVVHEIGLGSSRSARWIHARVLERRPLLPAHDFTVTEQILHTALALGLASTPLKHPEHFGPSRFGLMLAAGLEAATTEATATDPALAPLGFDAHVLAAPTGLVDAVRQGLVPEVDSVLIQSDLTAVATGPIAPEVHRTLRRYAVVEARGQGTVYRIDAATVEDSMQAGMNADDALAELAGISAEALPTTLEFLIRNTAAKLHRVQVAGARSVLVVDDPVDLDVIISDPLMLPAGLERLAPTVAIGQLGPERTLGLLEAGEHHALLHTPAGTPRRRIVTTQQSPEVHVRKRPRITDEELADYIATLRSPAGAIVTPTASQEPLGSLDRLREAAAQKLPVLIRLTDSHGQERSIDMVPTTVNGGRVRGKVLSTGAEASLSIARIVSVQTREGT